jgi:hypothetical protein
VSRTRCALRFLAVAFLCGCTRGSAHPSGEPASDVQSEPKQPSSLRAPPVWNPRSEYRYSLHMVSKVDFAQGAAPIDFDLDADCTVVALSSSGGAATLHAALSKVVIQDHAKQPGPALRAAESEMQAVGVLVALTDGVVSEFHVPRSLGLIAFNVYREIGSAMQFPTAALGATTYQGSEYDTTGRYVAAYRRDPTSTVWYRHKERYANLVGMGAASAIGQLNIVPTIVDSRAKIELSAGGRPQVVEAHDEIALEGAQTPVRGTTTLSLRQVFEGSASTADLAPDPGLVNAQRVAAGDAYGGTPAVDALDEARIGGMTFDFVVAQLERLGRAKLGAPVASGAGSRGGATGDGPPARAQLQEQAKLFEALGALYRREPAAVAKAVSKVKARSPASTALVAGLGSASTVQSQKALVSLMNDETLPHDIRTQASLALTRTPRPHAEAIDALSARLAAHPFDSTALFGLGTYSRRLRDAGDGPGAAALGELLLGQLERASATSDQITVLGALGNSGYAGALPAIRPYLASDSEEERAAAVGALKSMRDIDVDDLIGSRMDQDGSSSVRISAIDAARVRDPSDVLAHSVVDAAVHAMDAHVRYQATELMAAWLSRRPELRQTLQAIARDDAEPRVRERAQASL